MSQENIEIVRAAIEAFNAGDWEAVLKEADPDAEVDLSRGAGPGSSIYGRDQWQDFLGEFAAHWQSFQLEPHEFMEGEDHVVVRWTLRAVGRDGIEVEARVHWTWTIRDGKVHRVAYYPTREEALEAAGLSE